MTAHNLVILLGKTYDDVISIIVTPCRNKHCILVVVRKVVACGIVNSKLSFERQSLDKLVQVVDKTGIKLELTAHTSCLTAEIAVGNGVCLISLSTTREILSVEQVERLAKNRECIRCVWIDHIYRDQRCCILGVVRTHGCCLAPEVTLVLVVIVERGTCVGKALDELVKSKVNITTNAETIGVVVLCITEVQKVLATIVVDVGVEVCTRSTTLYLGSNLRTVVCLADILVGIVVNVRITVGIQSRCVIIDILLRISRG